ncbi:MAG: SusD/RagB family nutrient-binding outer membrane lipoprotein [Cyclobacteriaceae bacterium]|nr:SusD/RagB family nutrient-binding outer membrane lipoprotein [Cyclobacteriaceae bacterium]
MLMAFLISSCTDDFEEINTNDRVLTELDAATLGNMYGRLQYIGFYMDYHQISQNLFADHYCQYFANTQNAFSSDRYVLVGGWLNGAWNAFYSNIPNNLGEILVATDPAVNPGFETLHALAQIWRVIVYERIANYWGPIPYSQVNNAEPNVPYDSERDIYLSFFKTLDDALAILNANQGGNAFGANDQIYGGDIDKWIIFANTLRLRIAMRISNVEQTIAQTEAEKAVTAGVMTSNDDDAIFQTTANSPHNMPRMVPWNEFRMSAAMESVLKGYEDPRMEEFFSPAVTDGEYRGLRNGYEIVDLAKPELFYDNLSRLGPRWIPVDVQSTLPWEIMLSPEAYFLRAEGALRGWAMGGSAEELYNLGIEKSMIYWGITDPSAIAAYQQSTNVPIATHDAPVPLSTIPVKYDPAVALEQIMTQKWLGLYPDGWEAWAEVRRTDLPRMYPRMASENPDVAPDEMMRRVQFVSGEYETNSEAVQDALQKLGGPDKGSTRLWWNPAN